MERFDECENIDDRKCYECGITWSLQVYLCWKRERESGREGVKIVSVTQCEQLIESVTRYFCTHTSCPGVFGSKYGSKFKQKRHLFYFLLLSIWSRKPRVKVTSVYKLSRHTLAASVQFFASFRIFFLPFKYSPFASFLSNICSMSHALCILILMSLDSERKRKWERENSTHTSSHAQRDERGERKDADGERERETRYTSVIHDARLPLLSIRRWPQHITSDACEFASLTASSRSLLSLLSITRCVHVSCPSYLLLSPMFSLPLSLAAVSCPSGPLPFTTE